MDSDRTLRAILKARQDVEPVTPLVRQAQEMAKTAEPLSSLGQEVREMSKAADAVDGMFTSSLVRQAQEARASLGKLESVRTGGPIRYDPSPAFNPEAETAARELQMLDALDRQVELTETALKDQSERDQRSEAREQRMAELTEQSVKWARVAAIVGIVAVVVAVVAIVIST